MILQDKTLEKLRLLINEETDYRSGPKLVGFFNDLGFNDSYGQGFPSRWFYTDEKLKQINGTPELDKCIKKVFAPVNYIGRFAALDNFIKDFNQFLAFDKWKVVRKDAEIGFVKTDKIIFEDAAGEMQEDEFLKREFNEISIEDIGLDLAVTAALKFRFEEIKKCLNVGAPLSVLFLSGSSLEGVLLGIAIKNPKVFNQSRMAPKDKARFTSLTAWISEKTGLPLKLETIDKNENNATYLISSMAVGPGLPGALFTITPPKGTEVIDMRE